MMSAVRLWDWSQLSQQQFAPRARALCRPSHLKRMPASISCVGLNGSGVGTSSRQKDPLGISDNAYPAQAAVINILGNRKVAVLYDESTLTTKSN